MDCAIHQCPRADSWLLRGIFRPAIHEQEELKHSKGNVPCDQHLHAAQRTRLCQHKHAHTASICSVSWATCAQPLSRLRNLPDKRQTFLTFRIKCPHITAYGAPVAQVRAVRPSCVRASVRPCVDGRRTVAQLAIFASPNGILPCAPVAMR